MNLAKGPVGGDHLSAPFAEAFWELVVVKSWFPSRTAVQIQFQFLPNQLRVA